MKALAFDLGDTLVEYEGLAPSWEAHYPEALARLAALLNVQPTPAALQASGSVLRRYNTRLTPRETEGSFAEILNELLRCFGVAQAPDECHCPEAFFSVFRNTLRCFPDVIPLLQRVRAQAQKTGVFTDVPYGMPREFVMQGQWKRAAESRTRAH